MERHRDKKKCGMYLIEKTIFRYVWSFWGVIKQGREKSVSREEDRPNYEEPLLKFGFILILIESH